jgi:type I restriction enzyme, R subunit
VDRNDLDNQLTTSSWPRANWSGCRAGADSVDNLRDPCCKPQAAKWFSPPSKNSSLKEGETSSPGLNTHSNVILIADEAHRSQYGFEEGFARYLADAVPNAMRLGFTGTPISLSGADTVQVFGDLIHTYDIKQSQEDQATVPIYYEPRQIRLELADQNEMHPLQASSSGRDAEEVNRNIHAGQRLLRLRGLRIA